MGSSARGCAVCPGLPSKAKSELAEVRIAAGMLGETVEHPPKSHRSGNNSGRIIVLYLSSLKHRLITCKTHEKENVCWQGCAQAEEDLYRISKESKETALCTGAFHCIPPTE